jgi:hypothetical protein
MTTSRAEIVVLALEALGVLVNGAPAADDADKINRRIPYATAELRSRDVIYLGNDESFDDEVAMPFAEFVAAFSAPAFAMEKVRGVGVDAFRMQAEQRLRRTRQTEDDRFIIKRDYF